MPLINAEDLDTSPPEWLVDGLIPRTGLGFLHGPSYIGKSLVVDNELALAVANGTKFFGRDTVRGNVVLCLGEGLYDAGVRKQARLSRQEMADRAAIADVERRYGTDAAAAFEGSLPAYTDERLFVQSEPFALPVIRGAMGLGLQGGEASYERALQAFKRIPELELVILDALQDFSGGLSISNETSANRIVMGLKRLVRELECAVLVVAHDTVDGKKMLGAGRFFAAADFVMHVVPEETSRPGDLAAATIHCEKQKYGGPFEPIGYEIQPVAWDAPLNDDDGNPTGETVVVSTATVRQRDMTTGQGIRLPGEGRARPSLPEIRDVQRPRKRTGIRGGKLKLVAGVVALMFLSGIVQNGLHSGPIDNGRPAATAAAVTTVACVRTSAAQPAVPPAVPCRPKSTVRRHPARTAYRAIRVAHILRPRIYRHPIVRGAFRAIVRFHWHF